MLTAHWTAIKASILLDVSGFTLQCTQYLCRKGGEEKYEGRNGTPQELAGDRFLQLTLMFVTYFYCSSIALILHFFIISSKNTNLELRLS